jgi:hypothetical protein
MRPVKRDLPGHQTAFDAASHYLSTLFIRAIQTMRLTCWRESRLYACIACENAFAHIRPALTSTRKGTRPMDSRPFVEDLDSHSARSCRCRASVMQDGVLVERRADASLLNRFQYGTGKELP